MGDRLRGITAVVSFPSVPGARSLDSPRPWPASPPECVTLSPALGGREPTCGIDLLRVNRPEHRQLRFLLATAAAFEAGGEVGEVGVAVHPRDLDPVHCPGRAAVGALDLEAAPEADEITGRGDMRVGHSRPLARRERFVNMPHA